MKRGQLRTSLTEIHVCYLCGGFGTCKEGSLCYDGESGVPLLRQKPIYLHSKCRNSYDSAASMIAAQYKEGE